MLRAMTQDLENMEDALTRLSGREDIWQDRMIATICKAVYHLLIFAVRQLPTREPNWAMPCQSQEKRCEVLPAGRDSGR